jgi:hypothetical protein
LFAGNFFGFEKYGLHIKVKGSILMQELLEFIWTEGYSGRSSNPGLALAILVH